MNSILLVEDSFNDEALVNLALKKQPIPYELVVARDGREALDRLLGWEQTRAYELGHLPSFVLLDLKLPKINGLDVLREMRNHKSMRTIPVVIWSSSCESADVQKAYDLGANSYIQKPTEFEHFLEAIHGITSYWLRLNRPRASII
jgi:two-component system response regulator